MPGPFDLERFAPDPYFEFKLPGVGAPFRVFADPDVDQVAVMLRIEQTIQTRVGEEMAAAMLEGKQLLMEMIHDVDPARDLAGFRLGGQQLFAIFAGIMYGESVAQAVLEGIAAETPDTPPEPGSDAPEGLQHHDPDDPDAFAATEGADVAPLPSARRSSEPSSASDAHADTRQATGAV